MGSKTVSVFGMDPVFLSTSSNVLPSEVRSTDPERVPPTETFSDFSSASVHSSPVKAATFYSPRVS